MLSCLCRRTLSTASKQLVLLPELEAKVKEYRAIRAFNPEKWIDAKVNLFNDYLKKSRLSGAVVSISGGVDSAVVAALARKAMAAPGSPLKRFVAIRQPIRSSQWSLDRAAECCKALNIEMITVDQTALERKLKRIVDKSFGLKGGAFAEGQLRSYMRTPVNYYSCQLLGEHGNPAVVLGTGNMDEDGYLAYFCKAGDGVVDVQLIADLHKSEVFKVGHALGVPKSILVAPPSADLWPGQTDEDELGLTYSFVELLTGHYHKMTSEQQAAFEASLSPEAKTQFTEWKKKAESIHKRNLHKFGFPHNLNIL